MHHLSNKALQLELLDPADRTDQKRQGTRFSHGGYIWQVRDRNGVALLVGPEWPKPDPDPYNGQGLPESFRIDIDPAHRAELNGEEPPFLAAGQAKLDDHAKRFLAQPCNWHITRTDDSIEYCTSQSAGNLSLTLTRKVQLVDRTIRSISWLTNIGNIPFSLCWFAHPFLPLSNSLFTGEISPGFSIKENEVFALDKQNHLSTKRPFLQPTDAHIEWMGIAAGSHFDATISHPTASFVRIRTDFAPPRCAVWANSHTASIEPYLIDPIAPDAQQSWCISYEFGPSLG